jgi:epidermal growth factor receptor substrate 15
MSLITPAHQQLLVPGTTDRIIRRPDLRWLNNQRLSGMPLYDEIDYDDLILHRSWRSYEAMRPSEVRYFMFELSQRSPGETQFSSVFFKATRMVRLTRVPRYLRQATSASGPNMVFEQQRDVLVALRERGVLFSNVIAKSPQFPLIFAYGVQGIGSTPEVAQKMADEAYAVLDFQLAGTYQQLMYQPLNVDEGEALARYQQEWTHLAMARGRPLPAGATLGTASILDGNRTDIESTNNQLESFVRGMSNRSFMLSLITVPLPPGLITSAWRNLNEKLTEVRSETQGVRSVNAGVAFPLVMGTSQVDSHSTSMGHGASTGISTNEGLNQSVAHGISQVHTAGSSNTSTLGVNQTATVGQNSGTQLTHGVSQTDTVGTSQSVTHTDGVNHSSSVSASQSVDHSQSVSQNQGVNESSSLASGSSVGVSGSQTVGGSVTTGVTHTDGSNAGSSASIGSSTNSGTNSGSSINGGILGIATGGQNSATSTGWGNTDTTGLNNGTSNSDATSASNSTSASQTSGVSSGQSLTATNSVGTSASVGTSESVGSSSSVGTSETVGTSASVATSVGQNASTAVGTSSSTGVTSGVSASQAAGTSTSQSASSSSSVAQGTSVTDVTGSSRSAGNSQDISNSYAVALGQSIGTSGSLAVAPNFGVSTSRNIFDTAKQYIGDLLEAQSRRFSEGIKSGAFLYQMFLVCPDRETLLGAAGLLKSAFWGAGNSADQLPEPFHTIVDFTDAERARLLLHARALTSYRLREADTERIEPFHYSSYLTPSEAAAFTHPPVVEAPGMLAVHDSMPVMRMPMDRQNKDIFLGYILNGERGMVSDIRFGVDINEMTHTLIAGLTGSGKTTTLMRMVSEAVNVKRQVVDLPTIANPKPVVRDVNASILALDWMGNLRNLASLPELVNSGRFRFYSVLKPELGAFRWNPLAIPADTMSAAEWLNAQADNFTASFSLGEFGHSLISEYLTNLYNINRLEDHTLRPAITEEGTGMILRPAIVLPKIPREQIPEAFIQIDQNGNKIANVFTYPELSRTVGIGHLAVLIAGAVERAGTADGARLMGLQMRERLQSLWRRIQFFAPGGQYEEMLGADPDLLTRVSLCVNDLIDPERGLVTVIETEGLDAMANRLVLGSVMLAIYRFGLHHGKGVFNHNDRGPGCFVVIEESHELFGNTSEEDDNFSARARTALYEGMFRRVRALGLRLVVVAQQPAALPDAVTANISSVFIHRIKEDLDRKKAFALLNWSNQIGQQLREWRYLGEMPIGYCIAGLSATTDYTQAAPIQFLTDPAMLNEVSDAELASLALRYRNKTA